MLPSSAAGLRGRPAGAAAGAALTAAAAAGCPSSVGQGGSSARAAGRMAPSETNTIQNGLERGMKSGIIMARHRPSAPKTPPLHVHESDAQRGLLLLEDLGATLYLERLDAGDDPEPLYADALRVLALIQVRGREACAQLAPYGRAELAREMALMPEWFLARHLSLTPSSDEAQLLGAAFEFLIQEALAQPVVFVHRDYHARNLMVVRERNPGILDFQDALRGPVAYDLVSLLKDCYIAWPRERVVHWVSGHRAQLRAQGGDAGASEAQFLRWFDLIGVQRHIKVLGIFCRLWYRDGKPGYLPDLPRTLEYVRDTCARYAELAALRSFLEQRVVAQLSRATAQVAAERARAADGHA